MYEACESDAKEQKNCGYVAKVQEVTPPEAGNNGFRLSVANIGRALAINRAMSSHGLTPRIVDAWLCDHVTTNASRIFHEDPDPGIPSPVMEDDWLLPPAYPDDTLHLFTVMDKVPHAITVNQYLRQHPDQCERVHMKLMENFKKMHDLGIEQEDTNLNNVMVNQETGELQIIDLDNAVMKGRPLSDDERGWDLMKAEEDYRRACVRTRHNSS